MTTNKVGDVTNALASGTEPSGNATVRIHENKEVSVSWPSSNGSPQNAAQTYLLLRQGGMSETEATAITERLSWSVSQPHTK